MKLVHIIAGSVHGGAEKFCEDLVSSFSKKDITQHIITRPYVDRVNLFMDLGCGVSPLKLGNIWDFFSATKVKSLIYEINPDVILGWMGRGASYIPYHPSLKVGRLGGYYKLKNFKNCDHLICNTTHLVNYCIKSGWPTDKVHYIPNFSPINPFTYINREDLDIPNDAIIVLVLSRLEEKKGIDLAIRTVAKIPEAFLLIAGEGSLEPSINSLSRKLNLEKRVRFLGWRQDREALLNLADVCLVTSHEEPFGNVVLNCWASKTPVISTNTEGPSFLIGENKNGLLVPKNDIGAIASSIIELNKSKELKVKIVENGWREVNATFSEDNIVSAYVDFFNRYC